MKVASITRNVPTKNPRLGAKSFRKKKDTNDEMSIEMDTANPFSMLSAYFTTSATVIPLKT